MTDEAFAGEYLSDLEGIPQSQTLDPVILRQMFEGARYVRACLDRGEKVDMRRAYPLPMALYTPKGATLYGKS